LIDNGRPIGTIPAATEPRITVAKGVSGRDQKRKRREIGMVFWARTV
jgi:hypothetical protein